MNMKNGPIGTPVAGYIGIRQQQFGPINPVSLALPVAIPKTNDGNTGLGMFSKVKSWVKTPLTKNVINTQQSRF
jgi:hypothetical protein